MGPQRGFKSRHHLVIIAVVLAATGAATAQTATNLRVDNVPRNRHVLGFVPTFCWDYSGSQSNWQIQVDDDPNFTLNNHQAVPQVWFWDSGQQDKGASNTDRCAVMRTITMPGFVPVSLDRRPHIIYWRLRIKVGSTWGRGWPPTSG